MIGMGMPSSQSRMGMELISVAFASSFPRGRQTSGPCVSSEFDMSRTAWQIGTVQYGPAFYRSSGGEKIAPL